MSAFTFRVLEMRDSSPSEWLATWASRYDDDSGDDQQHNDLIDRHQSFSTDDFVAIGKWKDGVVSDGQWKPDVAMIAYKIWMEAASELPQCPTDSGAAGFLSDWSERRYDDVHASGKRRNKCFGLSRATTLLHFLSGGRYPILDSRVRTALSRLLGKTQREATPKSYLESYVPLIEEVAANCGTTDLRRVDKALFAYGSLDESLFSGKSAGAGAS